MVKPPSCFPELFSRALSCISSSSYLLSCNMPGDNCKTLGLNTLFLILVDQSLLATDEGLEKYVCVWFFSEALLILC